jgi:glycosyltransferase involved in cell wall biosynthesis
MLPSTPTARTPVLYVHYGDNWIRGSERCLLDLLANIDRDRFHPVLWCNAEILAVEARRLGVGVEVQDFPVLLGWTAPRFDITGYARLVRHGLRLLRTHRAQLVHANSGAPCQWMLPACRSAGVPLVVHLHAVYHARERHIYGLHHATRLVGVSPSALTGFTDDRVPAHRQQVIFNGIDPARLELGDSTRVRELLGPMDGPVIAVVGSLIRRKAIDVAIRAFKRVHSSHPTARLVIMGDGPERAALTAMIDDLGLAGSAYLVGEAVVGPVLRDCADILFSASRLESLGLSLLEGWWFGLPVVATNVEGHRDIVEHNVNGLLAPLDDDMALAAALERLIGDPALASQLGGAGYTLVADRFLVDRNVESFARLYHECIEGPRFTWAGPWHPPTSAVRWLAGVALGRLRRATPA